MKNRTKSTKIAIKICGLTDEADAEAAIEAGADFLGVVFFPSSPRNVSIERAQEILELVPEGIGRVGLFVDADDALIEQVMNNLRLDLFQFHGNETPERIEAVRQEYGMPVMKAIGIAEAADLELARAYAQTADRLLFDAKPSPGADRPGGNAAAFDWDMLAGRPWPVPWMLAGGLTPDNVADAIRRSGAMAVDVSSGVESAPGVKDPRKIAAFIQAVREL